MFAVEMQNITKSFGENVIANRSVNLRVLPGEIHALVGENGAGKSTLMKILYGMYQADSGIIRINGKQENIHSPAKAIRLHIGMVHQNFMLVNPLTVLENIILGNEKTNNFGRIDLSYSQNRVEDIMKTYNIGINTGLKISDLSVGQQQRVEILKILYRKANILILDEPTALLTPQEIDDLFNTLKDLKKKGKTVILITHKLNEVMDISDNITVMRHGMVVGELVTSNTNTEEIAGLMVDSAINEKYEEHTQSSGKPILDVNDLTVHNNRRLEAVKGVSFSVHAGEIFGIAGVEGNGQNELVEAITALRAPLKGTILVNGKEMDRKQAIAYIPADRKKNGMVMDFTVSENMILGREYEDVFSTLFRLKEKEIDVYTVQMAKKFDIRISNIKQKIKELSGGNQQKMIAARELSKNTELIVANHPTRGLDIKASAFVHNAILQERSKGKAVLLVSSDLGELLKLSDRIAVMFNGKITTVIEAKNINERELGLYMTGVN